MKNRAATAVLAWSWAAGALPSSCGSPSTMAAEGAAESAAESRPDADATALVPRAAVRDRGPIAIHKPLPVPPVETAGTGIAPSVPVRLTVDERGRVTNVEIRGMEPSTAYDAFYKRELLSALSEWRFAPALKKGEPAPSTLEWKIQFEPREASVSKQGDQTLPRTAWRQIPGAAQDDEMTKWHRYVASLPSDARHKVLEELRRTAEKHLAGKRIIQVRKGSFLVETDAASEATAEAIAQNLDVATGTLIRLFGGKIPPLPSSETIYAIVFSSKESFRSLNAELGAPDIFAGFYYPPGLIAVHLEWESSNGLVQVLLHESVHAYLDRYVIRAGIEIPVWVNEGLAEYLGNSDIKNGKIEPGGHSQRAVTYRNPMVSLRGPSASHMGAAEVKKAIRSRKAITIEDLVAANRNLFYGEQYRSFYTESWMLVHFLMKGKPSWASEEFPRFLLYIAEGFPASPSFRAAYGTDPSALEQDFGKYVERF